MLRKLFTFYLCVLTPSVWGAYKCELFFRNHYAKQLVTEVQGFSIPTVSKVVHGVLIERNGKTAFVYSHDVVFLTGRKTSQHYLKPFFSEEAKVRVLWEGQIKIDNVDGKAKVTRMSSYSYNGDRKLRSTLQRHGYAKRKSIKVTGKHDEVPLLPHLESANQKRIELMNALKLKRLDSPLEENNQILDLLGFVAATYTKGPGPQHRRRSAEKVEAHFRLLTYALDYLTAVHQSGTKLESIERLKQVTATLKDLEEKHKNWIEQWRQRQEAREMSNREKQADYRNLHAAAKADVIRLSGQVVQRRELLQLLEKNIEVESDQQEIRTLELRRKRIVAELAERVAQLDLAEKQLTQRQKDLNRLTARHRKSDLRWMANDEGKKLRRAWGEYHKALGETLKEYRTLQLNVGPTMAIDFRMLVFDDSKE